MTTRHDHTVPEHSGDNTRNSESMRAARRSDLTLLRGRPTTRGALRVRWVESGEELAVAYTIPSRGTTAVERNRLRRQLRAAVREVLPDESTGVLHITSSAREQHSYQDLVRDLTAAWKRIQSDHTKAPGAKP